MPSSPPIFNLKLSGDLCRKPPAAIALDVLDAAAHIRYSFIADQGPQGDDPNYQERVFHLRLAAHHLENAHGIVVCTPYVQADVFVHGAPNLVAIGRAGIGYDKIDVKACTANDVVVYNSPHGLTHSTAMGAMFFILALSKRYYIHERISRERRWDLAPQGAGDELAGLTLGIIGLGKTGLELARLMAPMRMRIIAFSRHADPAVAAGLNIELVGSMEEVLRRADYLSLHGRLDATTREMLGEKEFGLMKPTAFFVNVARGEMVDEVALERVLRERRIAGAALDVFHEEPLPLDHPLMKLENVILTQHSICGSRQAGRATNVSVMQGMVRISRGELPENILNPEVLQRPGFLAKLNRHNPGA